MIIFWIGFSLLLSCSHALFNNKKSLEKPEELAQRAIFEYMKQPQSVFAVHIGKGSTKIDPLLCRREALITNDKIYFSGPMNSDLLQYPLPRKTYRLVIPDSLIRKYRYTGDDKDYEHDYAIIHQFSPLLPTVEPNVYLMEHYIWENTCDSIYCVRSLNRDHLQFKVDGSKVTVLDGVPLKNQIDFIGFGSFSRKKMEEALPGEKIVKFGW